MPKISAVVPVYNVEKYLRECLDSIINQTLKDIEIICINDGSTDDSGKILEEYAQKDKRIKVITQKNKGAGAARNVGLHSACGDYLAILDSDDIYKNTMLEKMFSRCVEKDLDICICRSDMLDNCTQSLSSGKYALRMDLIPKKDIFNYHDMPKDIIGFCIGWSWDKLYNRDFVEKYHIRFPEIHNSEDAMFVFGSLCVAQKIGIVDEILVTHRTNTNTQLSERRDESPMSFIESAQILKAFLETNNVYKEVEQSFINWFVEHSFWHLDSLNIKNSYNLELELKNVFDTFGVFNHQRSYFYNQEIYDRLTYLYSNIPYCLYKTIRGIAQKYKIPVQNSSSHKVINILGIKIKIRRR